MDFKYTVLVLASGSFGPGARADSPKPPLVPGYEPARDLPGARELPDPKTDYKVVFADAQDAKNPGDVNPMLPAIATYANTRSYLFASRICVTNRPT